MALSPVGSTYLTPGKITAIASTRDVLQEAAYGRSVPYSSRVDSSRRLNRRFMTIPHWCGWWRSYGAIVWNWPAMIREVSSTTNASVWFPLYPIVEYFAPYIWCCLKNVFDAVNQSMIGNRFGNDYNIDRSARMRSPCRHRTP